MKDGGREAVGSAMANNGDVDDTYFTGWAEAQLPSSVGLKLAELFNSQVLGGSKHYKVACTWYGALAMAGLLKEQHLLSQLIDKYQSYRATYAELLAGSGHVDENVFGIVPLEISRRWDDAAALQEGLALADHQRAGIWAHKRYAIDDMFMITGLQVQAYRASGQAEYLELAAKTMVEYLERLQQDDGLFFHHEDFHHKWGRGNGWCASGMAELMRELPERHPDFAAIHNGYQKMTAGLLKYQIPEGQVGAGLWKQIVDSDDLRNWPETSGSAMFTFALVTGVRCGWLAPGRYAAAARAGWVALVEKLTPQGELRGISDWAYKPLSHPESADKYDHDQENYYFDRPRLTGDGHGQAPMLWTAAALCREATP